MSTTTSVETANQTTNMTMTIQETDREHRDRILSALLIYAQQKPRLEYGNYGDPVAYRAEVRRITRDLSHARDLLSAARNSTMTADQLLNAFYANRLSWDGEKLDYITGQYWPTEYRPAVCRVIVSALWRYFADNNGASATARAAAANAYDAAYARAADAARATAYDAAYAFSAAADARAAAAAAYAAAIRAAARIALPARLVRRWFQS